MKNGAETDVDCGGGACPKCPDTKTCVAGGDCLGGQCVGGLCCTSAGLAATCAGKCGVVTDNCGLAVTCPDCQAPAVCGGGGVPNVCGTPVGGPWTKVFSDPGGQVAANDIVLQPAGSAVVAGGFYATVSIVGTSLTSAGLNDAFLAKLDPDGNHVWSRRFGGSGNDAFNGVAEDPSGNIIACGGFNGSSDYGLGIINSAGTDAIVAKYSSTGAAVWAKSYGDGANQSCNAAATDAAGNVYVGGYFAGMMDFGNGLINSGGPFAFNTFVAKLGSTGNVIWSRSLGTAAVNETLTSMITDAAGNVFVLGYYSGTTNVGGPDLPVVPAGTTGIFVLKMDTNGNHVWSRGVVPSSTFAFPGNIALDGAGNVLFTAGMGGDVDAGGGVRSCSAAGNTGALVVKLGPAGNHIFSNCYPGTGNSAARGVVADAAGNVLVTGGFSGTVDLGGGAATAQSTMERSFFLLRLSPAGAYLGHKFAHSGEGYLLNLHATGHASVVGSFNGKIDLGTGQVTAGGIVNVFLGKIAVP